MNLRWVAATAAAVCFSGAMHGQAYLGFDRNIYPGDANLKALHQTFSYTGYWLNNPPGEKTNTWSGHRATVESAGFGFLVLFNGRVYAELKSAGNATNLGISDAQAATTAARSEGFPDATIIFLDQEEGGRMLAEQKAYIYSWVDAVTAAGFRAGVYCSGMPGKHGSVIAAKDLREEAGGRRITFWITNDACPPSPGCSFPRLPPAPAASGIDFADVWQFAQSPRRKEVAAGCSNYDHDKNCYPPGFSATSGLHVDLNAAASPDPSDGRAR